MTKNNSGQLLHPFIAYPICYYRISELLNLDQIERSKSGKYVNSSLLQIYYPNFP